MTAVTQRRSLRTLSRRRYLAALSLVVIVFTVLGAIAAYAGYAPVRLATSSPPAVNDFCLYHRPQFRKPSNAPGYEMDVNVWEYGRDNTSGGCFFTNAAKTFGSMGAVTGISGFLFKWSDGTVCTTISGGNAPSSYTYYGRGRAYNRTGACASVTSFGMSQSTILGGSLFLYPDWHFTY